MPIHARQKRGEATYSTNVDQLGFGSAIARDATSGVAKPELTDSCAVRSPVPF